VIGIDRFGESAPGPVLYEHFGLTPARIARVLIDTLRRGERRALKAVVNG
jgi:transketolase